MSKRTQRNHRQDESPAPSPGGRAASPWTAPIIIVAVLGVFGYLQGRQIRDLRQVADYRLDQIDTRLLQLSKKIEEVGKQAAAPPLRGPDPNRVYTIKTDGAPVKGPLTAPVTIAEFSDFQ